MHSLSSRRSRGDLDPRTKILLIFYSGLLLTLNCGISTKVLCFLAICVIDIFVENYKRALKYFFFYMLTGIVPLVLSAKTTGTMSMLLQVLSTIILIFMPVVFSLHIATKTIAVSDCICALRKLRFSDSVIIPIAVLLRFIPTIKEEWKSIRRAMKLRGIGTSFVNVLCKPMLNLEYVIIPIMMSTATIAEELAAASMSRGLAKGVERTSITEVTLTFRDYFVMISFPLLLFLLTALYKKGIIL